MSKEEFDLLKVGDIISNKAPFTDCNNNTSIQGYDYKVITKTDNLIEVKELKMGGIYTIARHGVEKCLNLKRK